MKQHRSTKTWERTRIQNLLRHKSGRYYARTFTGGKEVWKSLKSRHFEVAQPRLSEFLKEHRQRVGNANGGEVSTRITFGQAAEIHLGNLKDDLNSKDGTQNYGRQRLIA